MDQVKNVETIDDALTRIGIGRFQVFVWLITGFLHSCDAMEVTLLVFIGPFLTCFWKITIAESSSIMVASYLGSMTGAIFFGNFSDQIGRKMTLIISTFGILYFGLLCAASPTFIWLTFLRFLLGISIGGNASSQYAFLSEMTPLKYRGTLIILFQVFWVIGTYLITILSFLIFPTLGWRYLLVFATMPVIGIIFGLFWVPESPRILLLQNKKDQCIEVINKIAKMNKAEGISDIYMPPFVIGSFRDLIHQNYLSSTIILSFIMFVSGLTYFSTVTLATLINVIPHKCLQDMSTLSKLQNNSINNILDDSCCFDLNWDAYKTMLISTTGELVILPISLVLINVIGRKKTIAINIILISIGILFLNFCFQFIYVSLLFFLVRGSLAAMISVSLTYITEIFPTSVRSLGMGICSGCLRIGVILSPILVYILIVKYSFIGGTMLLAGLNLAASIASCLLPYETKDRILFQTAEEIYSETNHLIKK